jgi:hypothetical protein
MGLPQRVSLGVLMRAFPPALVDQLLDTAGRRERRQRLLPARLMVYFTLGMWIFTSYSYEEVLDELVRSVPGLTHTTSGETASAAAIGRARQRLGVEPLRLLFEQGASTVAGAAATGTWHVLRWENSTIEVPETPANRLEFGTPHDDGSATARAPRAHLSLLTGAHTGQVVAAAIGSEAEPALPLRTPGRAGAGMLLLMDGRPFSAAAWTATNGVCADRLWPLSPGVVLPEGPVLPDGSRLTTLVDADAAAEYTVRVIGDGDGDARPGFTPLVTSVLDHRAAPAGELVAVYDWRGPGASAFDGISTYQSGDRLVLRSKSPDLVRQELYAMLCVHHAIGDLIGHTMLRQGPMTA